jgi:hypothetical protein
LYNRTTFSKFPIKFPFVFINKTLTYATTTSTTSIQTETTTIPTTHKLKKFTRKNFKNKILLSEKLYHIILVKIPSLLFDRFNKTDNPQTTTTIVVPEVIKNESPINASKKRYF